MSISVLAEFEDNPLPALEEVKQEQFPGGRSWWQEQEVEQMVKLEPGVVPKQEPGVQEVAALRQPLVFR